MGKSTGQYLDDLVYFGYDYSSDYPYYGYNNLGDPFSENAGDGQTGNPEFEASTTEVTSKNLPGNELLVKLYPFHEIIEKLFGSIERSESQLIAPILSVDGPEETNVGDIAWAWEQARINLKNELEVKGTSLDATAYTNIREILRVIDGRIHELFNGSGSFLDTFLILRSNRKHLDCAIGLQNVSTLLHEWTKPCFTQDHLQCNRLLDDQIKQLKQAVDNNAGCEVIHVYRQFIFAHKVATEACTNISSKSSPNSDNFELKTDFISTILQQSIFNVVSKQICAEKNGSCTEELYPRIVEILCHEEFSIPQVTDLLYSMRTLNYSSEQDESISHLFRIIWKLAETTGFPLANLFASQSNKNMSYIVLNSSKFQNHTYISSNNYFTTEVFLLITSSTCLIFHVISLVMLKILWIKLKEVRNHCASVFLIVSLSIKQLSKLPAYMIITPDHDTCFALTMIDTYCTVSSTAWVAIEITCIYCAINEIKRSKYKSTWVLIQFIGWFLPVILVVIAVLQCIGDMNLTDKTTYCLVLENTCAQWTVLGTEVFSLCFVIVMSVKVIFSYHRSASFKFNCTKDVVEYSQGMKKLDVVDIKIQFSERDSKIMSKRQLYGLIFLLYYVVLINFCGIYFDTSVTATVIFGILNGLEGALLFLIFIGPHLKKWKCKRTDFSQNVNQR